MDSIMINICLDINISLGLCRLFQKFLNFGCIFMTKRSILVRLCHNNWELESDFVKICHTKKQGEGGERDGVLDDAYTVPDPTCANEIILVKITSSDSFFPTLFHLLATASCLYHGWNILGAGAWVGHFHGYKNDGGTRRAF